MYIHKNFSVYIFLDEKNEFELFIFSENQIKNYNVVTSFRERSIVISSFTEKRTATVRC